MIKDFFQNISLVWNFTALPAIANDNLIVDDHLENTVVPFNQLAVDAEVFRNSSRQTGGSVVKPSFYAINNPNLYPVLNS